MSNSMNATVAK